MSRLKSAAANRSWPNIDSQHGTNRYVGTSDPHPSGSGESLVVCSSGAPAMKISSKPKRSGPGPRPPSDDHRVAPEGAGRRAPAKRAHTTTLGIMAIRARGLYDLRNERILLSSLSSRG